MHCSKAVTGALLFTAFLGCSQQPTATIAVRGGGSVATADGPGFVVKSGENSAELKSGELNVNSKSYGTITTGAAIVVEEDGRVLINDQEVKPK
jgi:hypothetical protein